MNKVPSTACTVPALRAAIAGVNGEIGDVFTGAFSLGRERRGGRAAPLYRMGMVLRSELDRYAGEI